MRCKVCKLKEIRVILHRVFHSIRFKVNKGFGVAAAALFFIKHKDTKKQRLYLDTKTTSDLKVATKPAVRNFVGFVKSSFAALCIFRQRIILCFFVSLC